METLGERVARVRGDLGLTQTALAQRIGKRQSVISGIETGARGTRPDIIELAHALGVDAYWLKTGKGHKQGAGRALTPDQQAIIDAWPLLDTDILDSWVGVARKKLAAAGQAKAA